MDDLTTPFLEALAPHLPSVASADQIPMDTPLRELGLNSLRAVDLLLDLEDHFDVAFPDEALTDENFANAFALLSLVESLRVTSSSAVAGG